MAEAYLKAANADDGDNFGYAVGISGDTIVVTSGEEKSAQKVITNGSTGYSDDNNRGRAGAAYVFVRSGVTWAAQAYLKAPNVREHHTYFGYAVSISGDTIVVGAPYEDSNQNTIINGASGYPTDNSANDAGAAYVFVRADTLWAVQAYLKAPNADSDDAFGIKVAIQGDTIVVGAESCTGTRTNIINGATGYPTDNSGSPDTGAAYVFVRTHTSWAAQAFLMAPNADSGAVRGAKFGYVSISGDTIVAGARAEKSNQTTITNGATGYSDDNSSDFSGAVYVFIRSGVSWAAQAYLKAPNSAYGLFFGKDVSISGDTIVVGTSDEKSSQATITNGSSGYPTDNSAAYTGAAYVFVRSDALWAAQAYLKAPNADKVDHFGCAVSISADTIVVGAYGEASSQTTITNSATGYSDNNNDGWAGAVYVFRRASSTWAAQAYIKAPNSVAQAQGKYLFFGWSVGLSKEGIIVVGATMSSNTATTITNGATGYPTTTDGRKLGSAYVFNMHYSVVAGTPGVLHMDDGLGLNLGSGADAAKAVVSSGTCADPAGGGSSEVTDLGPGDSTSTTLANLRLTFTAAGTYKVCYKVQGGSYVQVGTSLVSVSGVTPTEFTDDGSVEAGGSETITLTGGTGMNRANGTNWVKAVVSSGTCVDAAGGGSSEVTDLGPDDSTGVSSGEAAFTFGLSGTYKLCYKFAVGSSYNQIGSSLLTVIKASPVAFSGSITTGTSQIVTLTGGGALKRSQGGDAAKCITSSGDCSTDNPAGGSSEVSDLGPDDADGMTQAEAAFTFTLTGDYKVCYKLAGETYVRVGTNLLTVTAVAPTAFSDDGSVETGGTDHLTLTGGSGLKLGSGQDAAKCIASSGDCSTDNPAGGSSEVLDLAPNDSDGATVAQAALTFTIAGDYQVCYKPSGGSYSRVGSSLVTVLAVGATNYTPSLVTTGSSQTVMFAGGSGFKLMATGGDTVKVVNQNSTCTDSAAGGSSEVTDLGPNDTDGATTAEATLTFTIAGTYKVCKKILGQSYERVGGFLTVAAVPPTSFGGDGAVSTGNSEQISIIGGSGLNLAANADSAKVVKGAEACSALAGGGSSEVTDLGPDNTDGSTQPTAVFTFTVAGDYKVCYKIQNSASNAYIQVGSTLLTVAPVAPTSFSHDGAVEVGSSETISLTGGSGFKLLPSVSGGDSAKVVVGGGACSDMAAPGTTEVTDLGPDDTDGAIQATMALTFTIAGDYKLCYKVATGTYVQVGSKLLWVGPTGFNDDGLTTVGTQQTITFTGGSGFNRKSSGGDAAKIVSSSDACSGAAAGGTAVVSDLGPDNADGATSATASVSFTQLGIYKVCYKVSGGSFVQIGSNLLTVRGSLPTSFDDDGKLVTGGYETLTLDGGVVSWWYHFGSIVHHVVSLCYREAQVSALSNFPRT